MNRFTKILIGFLAFIYFTFIGVNMFGYRIWHPNDKYDKETVTGRQHFYHK